MTSALTLNGAPLMLGGGALHFGGALSALSIQTTYVDDIAPSGVVFEVSGLTETQYLDAGFYWTADDSAGDYSLLRAGHPFKTNGKEFGIGPKWTRTFESAGTVNITCTVTHNGESRVLTTSHTTRNPDTVFGDANTFYASTGSSFPGGASNTYTTLAAALAAAETNNGGLVLLRDGETHDPGAGYDLTSAAYTGEIHIGRYDTGTPGAKPIIKLDTADTATELLDITGGVTAVITGIRFEANWNTVTETTTDTVQRIVRTTGDTNRVLFHDCEFDGLKEILDQGCDILLFTECNVTNFRFYGVHGTSVMMGFAGCNLSQHVDALGGGDNAKSGTNNDHGPARVSAESLAIWACDNFSNNGWTTSPANTDLGGGQIPEHQPAWRLQMNTSTSHETSIAGCVAEGGTEVVHLFSNAGGAQDFPGRHRLDSLYLIGGSHTLSFMKFTYGGTKAYNCICVRADVPSEFGSDMRRFVDSQTDGGDDATNTGKPIGCHNCAWVYLGDEDIPSIDDADSTFSNAGFTNVSFTNNLWHMPNHGMPSTAYAPLTGTNILTPLYKGFRWSGSTTLNASGTDYGTPATGIATYRPESGSSALAAASGHTAELDFYGAARSGSTAIGPFDGAA